ncbi:MAG: PilZ domain-containing protein [Inhella sp.]|jgi:hypothetical protein|uniref:PilZ domain-containing protein n=1 Tax=Inhella sp. TaxID=1921806 RepID=UPI0022C4454E|nr:PilZ domain-containing protein [Inhella sp.]MCZ8236112.1 PilZ domain-containing protein [Inhella sp.]
MTAPISSKDQRKDRRRLLKTTANVVVAGHAPLAVRTIDISRGGLGFVAAANPPANLVMTVRLTLPMPGARWVPIEVTGKVVYSVLSGRHDGFSIGLAFTSASTQTIEAIDAYVRS